jgi:monoamine oxidase
MSPTPLHALLVRAARTARLAETLAVPADEAAGALAEAQRAVLTRRRFLAGAAATAGALALDACARPVRVPERSAAPRRAADGEARVLVVGAGIAGLTAAWRLRQAGVAVRVAEAQTRVGGRMLSLRDHFADGQVAELGGELIDSGHVRIRALAAELGLALDDLAADDPALARECWTFGGARRHADEVAGAFAPIGRLIARDLAGIDASGIDHRATGDAAARAAALDRMSIAEWLDARGASGWLRDLLRVAYTTECGLEPDRQSALNFLTLIDPSPDPFRVFGDSDERFHVRGGNDRIPHALAARLGEGTVELGMRLVALAARPGGGWRATFEQAGGRTSTADATHVVLALPFTLLRDVRVDAPLSPAKRRAIDTLGYGTNAKLMVGFSERVWRTRHATNGSVLCDLPFQLTWETSRLQGGRAGILTNFTGGAHGASLGAGTAAEQADALVRHLDGVFPGLAAARAGMREARFHWPSHPWTRGSYAAYLPGQWTTVRGAEGKAEGTLHFAGEHTSREAQGFMEGGCESGERAAREVLATLRVTAAPAPGVARERARLAGRRRAVRDAVAALLG